MPWFFRAAKVSHRPLSQCWNGWIGQDHPSTTIYNDADIQKHFRLRRWVCASEDFYVCVLTCKIFQSSREKGNEKALQELRVRGELGGLGYLTVLEDVLYYVNHGYS